MQKDYLIAGLRVRMDTWGRTEAQAEDYLAETAGEPDVVITAETKELQELNPNLSLDDAEYLATGASFYRQLVPFSAMVLHSSAIMLDGYAYLFSAPCGTGKSTHTSMWLEEFGDKAQILNDDKPALRLEDGRWYAYGTPWSGKTAQNINTRVPLGGICVLTRGETNEIAPFGGIMATLAILEQTVRPGFAESRGQLMELLDNLLGSVPVWKLKCTPTREAAIVSHKALSEEARKRFG